MKCPRCGGAVLSTPIPGAPNEMTCINCGFVDYGKNTDERPPGRQHPYGKGWRA